MNTLEFLSNKSRELLNDQLMTFDSNNSKAGTFMAISALFVPITFSLFEKFASNHLWWLILFFIPIICNLVGIYFLIMAMYPKSVFHGINFHEFDDLINSDIEDIQLFEIGINRDSFNDNAIVLKKQNKNLKNGLRIIYTSAIILSLIFFVNLTSNTINMPDNNDQNTTTSSSNSNSSESTGSSNSDSSRQIPSTDPGQRSMIEKGANSDGDTIKK